MELILPEHRTLLKKMVGSTIRFGLMPNLSVESGSCLPDDSLYGEDKDYQSFYSSYLLNLRMTEDDKKQFWITIAPGPDSQIEPWSPLWITSSVGFDSGGIEKDYSFYIKSNGSKPQGDSDSVAELENKFLDTHAFGFGLNRISKWFGYEEITQIEIYDCAPYVACIIQHSSGKEWNLYAEYDFAFWLNFSKDMINGIRKQCKLSEIIR